MYLCLFKDRVCRPYQIWKGSGSGLGENQAIKQLSIPTNVREARGFLGLTRYYKRFVQHYGTIAAPLMQLLKLGAFKWTKKAQEAFLKLQNVMMTLPVLALPDFSLLFETEIDASGYGVEIV